MQIPFDARPIIIAVAGPNGAGKTTFCQAHLGASGLRIVNADALARELELESYAAANLADALRRQLLRHRESFIFETVFSDPVGDKINFLQEAAEAGYTVVLCFIGLGSVATSEERVAMRVLQGGHDVPTEKLTARFPRTWANLKTACQRLPHVVIFDNDDLNEPFRWVATVQSGTLGQLTKPVPKWLAPCLAGLAHK